MRRWLTLSLALLLLLVGIAPAHANRLFDTGFEENNVIASATNGVIWMSTGGTAPTAGTTSPHSGTYRLDTASGAVTSSISRDLNASVTSGTYYTRFYFLTSNAAPSSDITFFQISSSGAVVGFNLKLQTTGAILLTNVLSTSTDATAGSFVTANTWYRIEVKHVIADAGGSGALEVKLYNNNSNTLLDTLATPAAEDTLPTNVFTWSFGKMTAVSGTTLSFDDIAINVDNASGFQDGYPGPANLAMVKPASQSCGSCSVTWTPTGANCSGTNNLDCVDDLPGSADDSSGTNNTTTVQTDRFAPSGLPAEVPANADILLVDVWGKFGGLSTTGTNTARVLLWDEGGTQTQGPVGNLPQALCDINGWAIMSTGQHLAYDPGARTKANLDNFTYGYEPVSLAQTCRVTALWVNIEWLPVGGAPTRGLLGVGQ